MDVQKEQKSTKKSVIEDNNSVYQSLFSKINLNPIQKAGEIEKYENNDVLFESSQDERVTMAVNVLLKLIQNSSQKIDKLDKHLLDYHISQIDQKLSRQLDVIMHNETFQEIESTCVD
nr:type VI secretion system contractile sheath large subunit [uncultured Gilliamella sp.]